ncbi:MAG: hypothetical protein ABDH23_04710 [Endomicrobiia bacterium]
MKKILFCCGDRSADKYLSLLLKNIKQLSKETKTYVLAGEESKINCDFFIENLVDYDAHGFFSPFLQFFKFFFLLNKLKKIIKIEKITAVVLLDYYGFNIRVAKCAKKLKLKVIYYITPQVWATRKYRLKKIKKYVDFVINIYPFEKEIYEKFNIKNYYLGHPIVDTLQLQPSNKDKQLIGIFPGSRKQVIKWNLPVMLKIVDYFLTNYNLPSIKFVIFGFKKYENLYKKIIKKSSFKKNLEICFDNKDYLRSKIWLAISVSGTTVLENIFYDIPTIVIYKLPYFMYLLIKKMVYIKFISIPNIILKKEVIPEFIQNNIDPPKVINYIEKFLKDEFSLKKILDEYSTVKSLLSQNKNVSFSIAQKILQNI